MKYIKFKRAVVSRLETYYKKEKGEKKEELGEVLNKFKRAKNLIIAEKYFDVLRRYDLYANNFIEYYLYSEEEEIHIVRYRYEMLDYIMVKANRQLPSLRSQIISALDNKQGQCILLKYLRKIEYILDIDLRKYIVKVGILDKSSELRVLTDEEECDAMYDVARRLSTKHDIGYKLSYVDRSFVIDKYNIPLELYWDKGCVYHDRVIIANLLIGTNKVVEKIVRYYYKQTEEQNEIK